MDLLLVKGKKDTVQLPLSLALVVSKDRKRDRCVQSECLYRNKQQSTNGKLTGLSVSSILP